MLLCIVAHRGQRSIFTLIANSGSLHKFDNSCTARIFSLHDFQTILNAKDYACRGLCMHNLKIDLPPDPGPVRYSCTYSCAVLPSIYSHSSYDIIVHSTYPSVPASRRFRSRYSTRDPYCRFLDPVLGTKFTCNARQIPDCFFSQDLRSDQNALPR